MKFSDFINSWLYGEDGYYSKYKTIGKEGDFFTSVSTSMLFGGTIAKKIISSIEEKKLPQNTTIVEIGAHHGYLLADIIQFIFTLKPLLLKTLNFAIVERFEHLRIAQKNYFFESFGDEINLTHYNDIKDLKLENAFIISNEIFDAFSCELVITKDNVLNQAIVDDEFQVKFTPCEDLKLKEVCKTLNITKGEVPIGYEEFINIICNNIKYFEFLAFDYGDIYSRNDFSIRIYKEHNVYPFFDDSINLKNLYKKSDITFDVNFSHIINCFKSNGINEIKFQTQATALIDFGIIELLEIIQKNCNETTYLKEAAKVKKLIEPTGMGDRFKVLNVTKF